MKKLIFSLAVMFVMSFAILEVVSNEANFIVDYEKAFVISTNFP
jgi:hypothetical protein